MCVCLAGLASQATESASFLQFEDMKAEYSSASFYKANIALRRRIKCTGNGSKIVTSARWSIRLFSNNAALRSMTQNVRWSWHRL